MRTVVLELRFKNGTYLGNKWGRNIKIETELSDEELVQKYVGKEFEHSEGSEHLSMVEGVTVKYLLKDVLAQHKVKFTKPQQAIVDMLMDGWRLCDVSGPNAMASKLEWLKQGVSLEEAREGYGLEYAGKVYKAFWNIGYVVKKQVGVSVSMGEHMVSLY